MTSEIKVPSYIMEFQRERYIESMQEKIDSRPGIYADACAKFPFKTPLGGKETVGLMKEELKVARDAVENDVKNISAARSIVTIRLDGSYLPSYGGGRSPKMLAPAPTVFPTEKQKGIHEELMKLFAFKTVISNRNSTVPAMVDELDAAEAVLQARVGELKAVADIVCRLLAAFTETRFGGRRALGVKKMGVGKKAKK